MESLSVYVHHVPGVIEWNFEELKTALTARMQDYVGAVYTDDTVQTAKKDLADLRKLRMEIETRRKDIKEVCMTPYKEIEKQAKELTGLIDEPINFINAQVQDFEKRKKMAKREAILDYMHEAYAGLPSDVAERLRALSYDPKWENASCAAKTWQEAIQTAAENTAVCLEAIDSVDEDLRDAVRRAYLEDLKLSAALAKAAELKDQKEIVLENAKKKAVEEPAQMAAAEEPAADAPKTVRIWVDEYQWICLQSVMDEMGIRYEEGR